MSFGQKLKFAFSSSTLSSSDIDILEKYNNAVRDGITDTDELDSILTGASNSLKNTVRNANGAEVAIQSVGKSSRIAAVGVNVLKMALNTIALAAIMLIVQATDEWLGKNEELIQSAMESAEALNESTDSVEEYTHKIVELRNSLDSGKLSFDEQKSVREELLSIQSDMVDKYGDEIANVDILTDSVDKLVDTYSKIPQNEANEWLSDNAEAVERAKKTVDRFGVDYLDKLSEFNVKLKNTELMSENDLKNFLADPSNQYAFPELTKEEDMGHYGYQERFDNLIGSGLSTKQALDSVMKKIREDVQLNYDMLTGENGGISNLAFIDSLANKGVTAISGQNGVGLLDEDIELFKESGKYQMMADMPDLYSKMTDSYNEYKQALIDNDTDKAAEKQKELFDIYNDSFNVDDYESNIAWFIQDYLKEVIASYDTSADTIFEKEKEFSDVFKEQMWNLSNFNTMEKTGFNPMDALFETYDGKKLSSDNGSLFSALNPESTWHFMFDFVPELNDEEFDTALKIMQGKIDTDIDWFRLDNDEFVDLVQDTVEKIKGEKIAESFNAKQFLKDNNFSDVEKQVNSLKSALKTLDDGDTLDVNFFAEFTKLAPYANNTAKLREEITALANTKVESLTNQLTEMYEHAGDNEKAKRKLKTWIDLLNQLANIDSVNNESESIEDKTKALINSKIDGIDDVIEHLKDEKQAQEDIVEALKAQKNYLEETVSNYESAASTVTSAIDDEISAIEEQKQAIEDKYNEEINALQKENDERDRNIDLREKELALDKAKNTKVRVYDSARGFTIQTDTNAVKKAQKEYDAAVNQNRIAELEERRDKETAIYDERIQEYEDYKKLWEEAVDSYQKAQDEINAATILGSNWRERILNKDTGVLNSFASSYSYYQNQLHGVVEPQIADAENIVTAYENQITAQNNLKTEFETFLQSYEENGDRFITKTNEQSQAIRDLVFEIEKLKAANLLQTGGTSTVGMALSAAGYAGSFANGGVIDKTGTAQVHGSTSKPEVVFNSTDAAKLYSFVSNGGIKTFQNIIVENVSARFNEQVRKTFDNLDFDNAGTKRIVDSSDHSKTWNINGDIVVDSYDKFKSYMDRYVREVQMDVIVGKK